MDALITGEGDEIVGLSVIDNNDVEHLIEMNLTGEITGHEQDGYPDDPEKRTPEGKGHIQQAANYARYHVYRERGYETLDRYRNPDRLVLATLLVQSLSTTAFEESFGDLYNQLKSEYTDEEPVVDVHDALQEDAFRLYAKELYLGLDDGILDDLVDTAGEESVDAYLDEIASLTAEAESGAAGILDELEHAITDHSVGSTATTAVRPEDWIEAVSRVHVQWRVGQDIHREENDSPNLESDADAAIEVIPHDPESLDALQDHVVHHLRCQVRDQLVEMGVTPPSPFRVQGPGADLSTMAQQHFEDMQPFHDPDANIDWTAI